MEVYMQIVTTNVCLWHCNDSSIASQKRHDVQISPLELCQILVFVQPREKNLL